MSDKKKKRGRPRQTPILSYGSEMKMRNSIARKIKKPKYLIDQDDEIGSSQSRSSTPSKVSDSLTDDRSSVNGNKGRNSRGYNPDIDDKNSEYHYGSDFDSDLSDKEDSDTPKSLSDDENSVGGMDDFFEPDVPLALSEEEMDTQSIPSITYKLDGARPQTPVPVWLQERDYPTLKLPESSDDILLPSTYVLQAVGIYEVLRHFRTLVRLSPFRFEDFCVAILSEEQSALLAEIHISLLKSLIREEESQQTHFGPLDQKDSMNIILYFIDQLTWPETLRLYLQSDREFSNTLAILDSCNYPFTTLDKRLI